MNLGWIFLTGLTAGGLSCLAVQGGFLTSVIANQKKSELESDTVPYKTAGKRSKNRPPALTELDGNDWGPVLTFLIAKLVAHALLGLLLGWLGSSITLSLNVKVAFQALSALFMFATAMNLLDAHPLFRYLVFQPPSWMRRLVKKSARTDSWLAPAFLGVMTIFIPCGVTQAMEVLAISSADPLQGSLIMTAFVLGTTPIFAVVGVATSKLSETWSQTFSKVAATLLIGMAIYSFNGVLVVKGAPVTLETVFRPVTHFFSSERFAPATPVPETNGVQRVVIGIFNNGYSPNYVRVKKGVPVQLTLQSRDTYSCALAFVFNEFGIETFLDATDVQTYTFTPQRTGKFTYTCSMGMYSGVMEVI